MRIPRPRTSPSTASSRFSTCCDARPGPAPTSGSARADRAWGGRGPQPLDCAIWALRANRAHDGDYVGTVEALAAAGAPTGHRPPSPDPAVDRVLERYGVW